MYYAQIDLNGICYAVTETSGIIEQADMIPIDGFDQALLGKKRVENAWEDVPIVPIPEPQPSKLDQLEQVVDALLTGGETA